jgi:hypothetical protein
MRWTILCRSIGSLDSDRFLRTSLDRVTKLDKFASDYDFSFTWTELNQPIFDDLISRAQRLLEYGPTEADVEGGTLGHSAFSGSSEHMKISNFPNYASLARLLVLRFNAILKVRRSKHEASLSLRDSLDIHEIEIDPLESIFFRDHIDSLINSIKTNGKKSVPGGRASGSSNGSEQNVNGKRGKEVVSPG